MKRLLILMSILVLLPVLGVEAASALPLDLYPSEGDLGKWFLMPQIKVILLTIIITGLLAEIKTAGAGIAGGIAMIAAVALFGMDFFGGDGSWLEILLFIGGLGFLMLELFIPGFGLFGVAGLLCLFASFYYVLGGNQAALIWLAVSIVAAIAVFALLIKYLPQNRAWNLFVLKDEQKNSEGYSSAPDLADFLGKEGIAVTILRPAGTALFDNQRVDVVTGGDYLESGTRIVVVKVEGSKVIVAGKENI